MLKELIRRRGQWLIPQVLAHAVGKTRLPGLSQATTIGSPCNIRALPKGVFFMCALMTEKNFSTTKLESMRLLVNNGSQISTCLTTSTTGAATVKDPSSPNLPLTCEGLGV